MMVDGKALAATVRQQLSERVAALAPFVVPHLTIITCAPTFETRKYLALKERMAAAVGIRVSVHELPEASTTAACIEAVAALAREAEGVIVQLPLPPHIDREAVLASVPVACDVDGFWYGSKDEALPSPVVAAIGLIADAYGVPWADQSIVVVGEGRLVGKPVAAFLRTLGVPYTVVTESTPDATALLSAATIIISGAGRPSLITADMVRPGVIVFDAGTSEEGGVLVGDVHPAVAAVATLFTPVPGGIGPLTIVALLSNVITLAERQVVSRT